MKRWATLFSLFLFPLIAGAESADSLLEFRDFSGGLNSNYSSITIADNEVKEGLNVLFDEDHAVTKRKGYTLYGSTGSWKYVGGWAYTDSSNNSWIITLSSSAIFASKGDGGFTVQIATVPNPSISPVDAVNAFGNIYFVDRVQGVYYWNGTAVTYIAGSPPGSIINEYKGRLWVAGEDPPNQNRLRSSAYLDATNWTTASLVTSPVSYTVGLNDRSDAITSLFTAINDAQYIFKNNSIYALYGFDQDDFQIRILNTEAGCIEDGTVQSFAGGIVFLSKRGFELFDGVTPRLISKKIQNKLQSAFSNNISLRSWVQDTGTHWNAGTITPTGSVSTATTVGSVVLTSSGAFTAGRDDAYVEFNAGTLSNVTIDSTHLSPYFDSVYLSQNGVGAARDLYCPGSSAYTLFNTCSQEVAQSFTSTMTYVLSAVELSLDNGGSPTGNYELRIKADSGSNTPGTLLSSTTFAAGSGVISTCGTARQYSVSLTAQQEPAIIAGTRYWIEITGAPGTSCASFLYAQAKTGTFTEYFKRGSTVDTAYRLPFRLTGFIRQTSGTLLSRTIDTGFDTTWWHDWGALNASVLANNQTITFETQTSTDGSSWDALQTVANLDTIPSAAKRYIRYKATLASSNAAETPRLVSVDLNVLRARKKTGTLVSQINDVGTNITAWSTFNTEQDLTNNGTIEYSVCTSAASNMSGQVCANVSPNSQISAPVERYVRVYSTFTVTQASYNPRLDSFTLKWTEGVPRPRMTSAVFQDRYWVALTTDTASAQNDATFVLAPGLAGDRLVWTLFDIKAGAFIIYRNSLYHADSNATGNVYLDNEGYTDAGTAINAYFTTKDYSPTNFIQDKVFKNLWVQSDSLGNYNFTTSYFLDRHTNEYALSTVNNSETVGLINAKLPFPLDSSHQVFGRTISFKFGNNEDNAPFKLYGGVVQFGVRPPE